MPQPLSVELPRPLAAVRVIGGSPAPAGHATGPAGALSNGSNEIANRAMQIALETERAKLAQARQALEEAAAEVTGLYKQVLADAEAHLLDLAVEIARKVLMQDIQAGRHEIEPIVREALRSAPTRREVVVRLNPEDLARMDETPAADSAAADPNVRLVADPRVGRAECVVETAEGTVEARIENELQRVKQALKNPE